MVANGTIDIQNDATRSPSSVTSSTVGASIAADNVSGCFWTNLKRPVPYLFICLNNPGKRNALSEAMVDELLQTLQEFTGYLIPIYPASAALPSGITLVRSRHSPIRWVSRWNIST